jgi:hypothetical protein
MVTKFGRVWLVMNGSDKLHGRFHQFSLCPR